MNSPENSKPRLSSNRLSTLYFFYFAFLGSHGPYISAILKAKGLSASELSLLMGALPLLTIVAPPFWAGLADRLKARAKVLSMVLLGAAVGCSAFLAIQGIWSGLAVILLYGFFRSPVITLTDALTHAMIHPHLERFGIIRLWGSVGFIFGSVSIGQLRTLLPDTATQLISAGFLVVAALLVRGYDDPVEHRDDRVDEPSGNTWQRGLQFMLQPTALFIALGNLFHAMGHSSFDAYFALFAQEHNVGDHIIGFGWGIGVTAEVIIMRIAPSFLREHRPTVFLMLGSGAAAFRWAMMYYLNDPVGSLWLQPLHALTFGLWYLAFSNWLQNRVPPDIRATCQGFFLAVMSLGMASGNLLGGQVISVADVRSVYGVAVLPALMAFSLYLVSHLRGQKPGEAAEI